MARSYLWGCLGLILSGTVAAAQDREAPEYFLDAVIATSTAQTLALSCDAVSLNPVNTAQLSQRVLVQLEADGFDTSREDLGMADASDALAERQDAFVEKHGLNTDAGEDSVCAAAEAEIDEGSAIGKLLLALDE